jgi:Fe-S-cluster containining protein
MERRFHCTECGKCCFGLLPLTLDDALKHAGRFPLVVMWTPVRQGTKSFGHAARLGTTIRLGERKQIAVRIAPTAYIPPSLPCPALAPDGLCSIHAEKPSRCRTMPFFPYREELDQAQMLTPRSGWECDTSPAAPVVYRDQEIVHREDFDYELGALVAQAAILGPYADWLLESAPTLSEELVRVAKKRSGGHVVVNFSTPLLRLPHVDVTDFARRQFPVMTEFAAKTAAAPALAEYHQHYRERAEELGHLLDQRPRATG